ncbi:MAG: DUF309 domain-containing protein [Spirochaetia bacterium]|nr:DUF309 domain-containing protein [Spirochaetia bacterium]
MEPNARWVEFTKSFNEGKFYEAHEAAEFIWAARGYQPRDMYRGLTQIAVSLEHLKKGNAIGARRVLDKAQGIFRLYQGPAWIGVLLERCESIVQMRENSPAAVEFPKIPWLSEPP